MYECDREERDGRLECVCVCVCLERKTEIKSIRCMQHIDFISSRVIRQ